MKIFLDDVRKCPDGFELAQTYDEVIQMLINCDAACCPIECLSLDNDLGEEKEGRHVLDWIEEQHITNGFPLPKKITIHSANPVARNYMQTVIERLYEKNH